MKLGRCYTRIGQAKLPVIEPMTELRIRTAAALDCLALARANPASLQGALNMAAALGHARAVLRSLPRETIRELFAKDASP